MNWHSSSFSIIIILAIIIIHDFVINHYNHCTQATRIHSNQRTHSQRRNDCEDTRTVVCAFLLRAKHCYRSSSFQQTDRVFSRNNRSSASLDKSRFDFPSWIRTNTNTCHLIEIQWLSLSVVQHFSYKHSFLMDDAFTFAFRWMCDGAMTATICM